jgi:hypothetical protein
MAQGICVHPEAETAAPPDRFNVQQRFFLKVFPPLSSPPDPPDPPARRAM